VSARRSKRGQALQRRAVRSPVRGPRGDRCIRVGGSAAALGPRARAARMDDVFRTATRSRSRTDCVAIRYRSAADRVVLQARRRELIPSRPRGPGGEKEPRWIPPCGSRVVRGGVTPPRGRLGRPYRLVTSASDPAALDLGRARTSREAARRLGCIHVVGVAPTPGSQWSPTRDRAGARPGTSWSARSAPRPRRCGRRRPSAGWPCARAAHGCAGPTPGTRRPISSGAPSVHAHQTEPGHRMVASRTRPVGRGHRVRARRRNARRRDLARARRPWSRRLRCAIRPR
jgi:hypothetical protein